MAESLDPNNLFLATAVESDRRAAAVLPEGPTEDARHVLGQPPSPPDGLSNTRELPDAEVVEDLIPELEDADEAWVALVAPDGQAFEGREVWDALTSLGLHWGDMDLFHWENPSQQVGDDHLFSVYTSTPPGYFLPEEASAGRLRKPNSSSV